MPAEGTLSLTFVNPDPVEGDEFIWQRYDRPNEQARAMSGDTVVIDNYVLGTQVCLEVRVKRGAKTSADPLEECFPS